jgi:hypothetical protein
MDHGMTELLKNVPRVVILTLTALNAMKQGKYALSALDLDII